MIDIILDYLMDNKYVFIVIGVLFLNSLLLSIKHRMLKKRMKGIESWAKEMYEYVSTHGRGGQ